MDFDRQKFVLEKYYDIIKLRAAQVLALFVAYGLALRDSDAFLDTSSVLAMVVPLAALVLDLVARRHYGAPLVYAAILEDINARGGRDMIGGAPGIALIIVDPTGRSRSYLTKLFSTAVDEKARRKRFNNWYTFRDQLVPAGVFGFFFATAFFATGGGVIIKMVLRLFVTETLEVRRGWEALAALPVHAQL